MRRTMDRLFTCGHCPVWFPPRNCLTPSSRKNWIFQIVSFSSALLAFDLLSIEGSGDDCVDLIFGCQTVSYEIVDKIIISTLSTFLILCRFTRFTGELNHFYGYTFPLVKHVSLFPETSLPHNPPQHPLRAEKLFSLCISKEFVWTIWNDPWIWKINLIYSHFSIRPVDRRDIVSLEKGQKNFCFC